MTTLMLVILGVWFASLFAGVPIWLAMALAGFAFLQFAGIPVVVHSSLTGSASELQAQSAGADAYIAKFHIDELADKLREVLAMRS